MADTTNIDDQKIRNELTNYIRNLDIISTSTRGVTTGSDTGTFSAALTYTLSHTNAKNVRSVIVAAVTLKYGRDYTLSTTGGVITFTSAQTGAYTISYDYGNNDRIFPDMPQQLATITDFPRIGMQWLGISTEPGGFGSVDLSNIDLRIVVYAAGTQTCSDYITTLRSNFRTDKSNFWYLGAWVQILTTGPFILEEKKIGQDKLVHQNIDIRGRLRYEK